MSKQIEITEYSLNSMGFKGSSHSVYKYFEKEINYFRYGCLLYDSSFFVCKLSIYEDEEDGKYYFRAEVIHNVMFDLEVNTIEDIYEAIHNVHVELARYSSPKKQSHYVTYKNKEISADDLGKSLAKVFKVKSVDIIV